MDHNVFISNCYAESNNDMSESMRCMRIKSWNIGLFVVCIKLSIANISRYACKKRNQ